MGKGLPLLQDHVLSFAKRNPSQGTWKGMGSENHNWPKKPSLGTQLKESAFWERQFCLNG